MPGRLNPSRECAETNRRKCARGRKKRKTSKSGAYRITPGEEEGKRAETCKMLQIDFTIRKKFQFRVVSKPQFSPPVPKRGIIDQETVSYTHLTLPTTTLCR